MIPADWVAILLATALNMLIHTVWYSKWLFRSILSNGDNLDKGMGRKKTILLIFNCLGSFFTAYFLAYFESVLCVTSVVDGILVGFCCWLGFVFTTQITTHSLIEKSLKVFYVHTGCKLISFLAMSGLIAA